LLFCFDSFVLVLLVSKNTDTRRLLQVEAHVATQHPEFVCPLSIAEGGVGNLMMDPVVAADGHTYEKANFEQWVREKTAPFLSPKTGARSILCVCVCVCVFVCVCA